ncbi:fumarylacetoacetate hydrolase family protein [Roseomonas sp. E05]|uniref:fumarylacetoacetate hydrolase family protein n=1 Tax=Roseomonas sp. E05 TaxID=3046310 RepID=UPI0024B9F7BF|nr:fumarylacetoacetate hydrolase family protein [Roseomonas sp. E05]MDJ0391247.1 fumarylacetoacetate hydrolase family protein [Roseomonas sp. E05]
MTDIQAAAAQLAALWRSGAQVEALPPELRPADLGEAYDIQDALVAQLGEPVVGWKLGVGSHKQRRETGFGRPIAGRVLGSRQFRIGDTVPLPDAAPATVEFEIAFVLGCDIHPDAPPPAPASVIAETRVAFELVRARFRDRRSVGWPSFAADNAGFDALVLGERIDPASIRGLTASLSVSADGVERARAATGEDASDPLQALADLMALARERDMLLPRGAVISTGTASVPFTISGAAQVVARWSGTQAGFSTRLA